MDRRQTNAFWLTWSQEQVLIGIACLPPDPRSESEVHDDGELRHKLVMLGARAENFHSMARITLRHEDVLCWAIQRVPAWIGPAYEVAEDHASTVAIHAFFDLLQLIPLKAEDEDMPENADSLERLRRGVPLIFNS